MLKNNITPLQYEEFWDDCIKLQPKKNKKIKKRSKSNKKQITLEPQKKVNNKIIFRENNNSVKGKNYKLIKKVLTTEESIHNSMEKKKQKRITILASIYDDHISKKKKAQDETFKLKENLILKEKKNCTFKPKNYAKHRSVSEKCIKKTNKTKNIYERCQEFKDKLYTKWKEIKHQEHKKEKEEYPFQPELNHNNIGRILYGDNYWEELANNLSNEIFLRRYKKAREEENEKKKKLILNFYNVNDSINDEVNNKPKNIKFHKSISQKNSLIYRQTLHNYLLEYETNDEDNSNENKKNNKNNMNNMNNNIKIIKN